MRNNFMGKSGTNNKVIPAEFNEGQEDPTNPSFENAKGTQGNDNGPNHNFRNSHTLDEK